MYLHEDHTLEFNETITISQKNLVIKTVGGNSYNIKSTNHIDTFFDIKKNNSRIRLEGITFINTTFFKVNDKNTTVDLVKCKINNSEKPIITFVGTDETSTTKLTITESSIQAIGLMIDHTSNRNDQFFLHIKDSQITGGALISTTASSLLDIILQNVKYESSATMNKAITDKASKFIQISATSKSPRRPNLVLDNITITGQFNKKVDFLYCSFCDLNATLIKFYKAQINTAFTMSKTRGKIHKLQLHLTTAGNGIMKITQSDFVIGEFIGDNVITNAPVFEIITWSNLAIKKTQLKYSTSVRGQLFKVWIHSTVTAEFVEVIGCRFKKIEVLRIASDGAIAMRQLNMKNTECCNVVLAYWVDANHRFSGTISIDSALIVNNTAVTTLIGVVNTNLFKFTNAVMRDNRAVNMFVVDKSQTTVFENLTITENTLDKCFELKQCNVDIQNVNIYNNKIDGYGKALYYEKIPNDSCVNITGKTKKENFTINIRNFRAVIENHARYDPKKPILSIDITHSSLNFENVEIDVSDMSYYEVKGVSLEFKTLNERVHPALKIVCPTNYNPSHTKKLGQDTFSYAIDCIPCPRGLYSVERGSEDILYIDNKNLNVHIWDESRRYLHRNPPVIRQCKACPTGGICTNHSIKSLGNYYGSLIKEEKRISFVPCPNYYCCSNLGQACTNYTSCNFNRRGTLCGTCDCGYYESYFSPKCISKAKCTVGNQVQFWVIFNGTALILTVVICSTKDVAIICMCFLNYLRRNLSKFARKLTKYTNPSTDETIDLSWFIYKDKVVINSCIIQPEVPVERKFIFSTIIQIVLSFFQIVSLISLKRDKMENTNFTRVVNLFNLQITVKEAEELCPSPHFTVIWKHFTKDVLFIVTMLLFLAIPVTFSRLYGFMKSRYGFHCTFSHNLNVVRELKKASLLDRVVMGFIKILMFGYKNISLFTILSLHCVEINETRVLFISGDVQCYQKWQWAVTALFLIWVIPFPVALVISYRLFTRGSINYARFIACLIFPPLIIHILIRNRHCKSSCLGELHGLKALLFNMFEAPYRVTSQIEGANETMYWWTAWRLYERLIIAMLVTFISQPLLRMCVVAPVIVCFLLLHYNARPYKESMSLLSWLDISAFACLTFYTVDSMFRSFLFTFDIRIEYPVNTAFSVLEIFRTMLTPLTILCMFVVHSVFNYLYQNVKGIP